MRRFAFATVVLLGLALPARAFDACWCPPPPVCGWPVMYFYAPILYVPISVAPAMAAAPVPVAPKTTISTPRPLTTETIPEAKAAAPAKEPVRPAAFDAPAEKPVLPPMKSEPLLVAPETIPPTPVPSKVEAPKPVVAPPPVVPAPGPEFTKPLPSKIEPPKLEVAPPKPFDDLPPVVPPSGLSPSTPGGPLTLPEVPKPSKEKSPPLPDLVLPPASAVPVPAPAPSEPSLTLPSASPQLPLPPEVKSDTGLPPLVLPPVKEKVTAQSSPLALLPKLRMIPVAAATHAAPAGKGKVGVFNYTDRDWELVIAGEKVTLPRRSYIDAEVPATFAMKIGNGESKTLTIPAGQAGIEMVLE